MKAFKTVIGAALAACLLQAPAVGAEEADLPIGTVEAKNLVERTVTIDDQTFRVTGSTKILGPQGVEIPLEGVQTAAEHGPIVALDLVTYAYDASGGSLSLLKWVPLPR